MPDEEWTHEKAMSDPLDWLLEEYGSEIEPDDAVRAALAPYDLKDWILVSPDGTAMLVIVPDGPPPGVAVIDPSSGDSRPFDDVKTAFSDDPRLRLTPEAELIFGDPGTDPWRFGDECGEALRFPAEAWEGANEDRLSSDNDEWRITVNGERVSIDLERGAVAERPVKAKAGSILHIDWGPGYARLRVDERGLVWYKDGPEVEAHFLMGPARPPLSRYLTPFVQYPEGWINCDFSVSTDLLTRAEMAAALRYFADELPVDLDDWRGTDISVHVGSESLSFEELMGFET